MPTPVPGRLPRSIRAGLILVGLGVLFTGISYGWNFFGIRASLASGFVFYITVEVALSVIEYLCLELGLFLILRGILRLLPRVLPWSRLGPIILLVGAFVVTGLNLAELALVSLTYPPAQVQVPEWAGYVLSGILIAGYIVATLGLLLSLLAVAKGVVLRSSATPGPPPA